jgi:hypothetical protein
LNIFKKVINFQHCSNFIKFLCHVNLVQYPKILRFYKNSGLKPVCFILSPDKVFPSIYFQDFNGHLFWIVKIQYVILWLKIRFQLKINSQYPSLLTHSLGFIFIQHWSTKNKKISPSARNNPFLRYFQYESDFNQIYLRWRSLESSFLINRAIILRIWVWNFGSGLLKQQFIDSTLRDFDRNKMSYISRDLLFCRFFNIAWNDIFKFSRKNSNEAGDLDEKFQKWWFFSIKNFQF